MSWSQRRRASYIGGVVLFIIIFIVIPSFYIFYERPTCFDEKLNQSEQGVDCGGPCSKACRSYFDLKLKWTRSAKVTVSGLYNLIAYLENPNIEAGARGVLYNFKVYDGENILIAQRSGETIVPANKNFVVFEDGVDLKDKIPKKVSFEILNQKDIKWFDSKAEEGSIFTLSKSLLNENTKPRIEATVENRSLSDIKNVEFTVVAYDSLDNAVAFSRTKLDRISPRESQDIIFTWPEPFSAPVMKTEILTKVLK